MVEAQKSEDIRTSLADDTPSEDATPMFVVKPDDIVDAKTKARNDLPSIGYSYKPMTSLQHSKYLDRMKRAGDSIEKLQMANYYLLSQHIVSIDLPAGQEINVSERMDWSKMRAEVIFDIAAEVAGLEGEEEGDRVSDL